MRHSSLVPCSACRRHVRLVDGQCPFCGGRVVDTLVPASPPRHLSRAAMVAFAATLVPASMAGCSSDADTDTADDAAVVSVDAVYGAPFDAPPPDTATTDSVADVDADASTDSGEPLDVGSFGDVYGAPFDSGSD